MLVHRGHFQFMSRDLLIGRLSFEIFKAWATSQKDFAYFQYMSRDLLIDRILLEHGLHSKKTAYSSMIILYYDIFISGFKALCDEYTHCMSC